MKTTIVLPYNTADDMTIECLDKLKETIIDEEVYVILVHGYVDERTTIDHPFVNETVKVKNESYCKTLNEGLRRIPEDSDYVFFLGNDSFPTTKDWLKELINLYEKYDLVLLSPDYTRGGKRFVQCENNDLWYHSMLPSIHYLIKKVYLEEIGLMDEDFVGACYYSDDDYCMRINNKYGVGRIARTKNLLFEHRLSVEGTSLGVATNEQMSINNEIYRRKWG